MKQFGTRFPCLAKAAVWLSARNFDIPCSAMFVRVARSASSLSEIVATFRAKSRLVEILGKHLIKDNTVGLLELVKNAYDADATVVEVSLQHLDNPDRTVITVSDNGDGMTLGTVTGAWLEPAHAGKEEQKARQERSKRGRLPLGEKGIGRFAAHKLGKELVLITRDVASDSEVVLEIDWTSFESHDTYLEDIELHPETRKPTRFKERHGTTLIMRHARERWRRGDLQRLQASLQKLKSPTRGAKDFEVRLHCPDFPEFENLDSSDILDRAHFSLVGLIDANGIIEFDYTSRLDNGTSVSNERRNLWSELNPRTTRAPSCGAFFLQLSAWLRTPKLLQQLGVTKDQLDAFSGVNLFRDGIRVLPYGDEGDDWLLLDKRRIDDPTRRLANNQVIGAVEITQTENQPLIDKANREGLQENEPFSDFTSLVKAGVRLLEQYSFATRQGLTGKKKEGVPSKAELATSIAEVEEAARRAEAESREVSRAFQTAEEKGWVSPEAVTDLKQKINHLQSQVSAQRVKAEAANETVREVYSQDAKEREDFLHLVAVGLIAERFTHEFERIIAQCAAAMQQLRIVTKGDATALEAVQLLERNIAELQNELIPLGNVVHRASVLGNEECNVPELITTILANNRRRLEAADIVVEKHDKDDKFVLVLRESLLAQVFDNIIDNAIYWLEQKTARDERRLNIYTDPDERTILITNSGPAIQPHVKSRVFRKFVTTKHRGHGLGLFISHELLAKHGANIRLIDREDDPRCFEGA